MSAKRQIPVQVKDLMKEESSYRGRVAFLGSDGITAYFHYAFAEPVTIGFPKVVALENNKARVLEPYQSLRVFRLFCKD